MINDDNISNYSDDAIKNIKKLFTFINKYNYKKDVYNEDYILNLGNYNHIYDKTEYKNDKDRILNEIKEIVKEYNY